MEGDGTSRNRSPYALTMLSICSPLCQNCTLWNLLSQPSTPCQTKSSLPLVLLPLPIYEGCIPTEAIAMARVAVDTA